MNWQDSQNALCKHCDSVPGDSHFRFGCGILPKMQFAKWPCSGLPCDGATECEMQELSILTAKTFAAPSTWGGTAFPTPSIFCVISKNNQHLVEK